MSSYSPPSSTSLPHTCPPRLDPKIRYYIHRAHKNTMVPLIPADQLPFRLKDFPQNMNHRQLSDGGWKFLEETPEVPFPLALLSPRVQGQGKERGGGGKEKDAGVGVGVPTGPASTTPSMKSTTSTNAVPGRPALGNLKSLATSIAAIYAKDARRIGYTKVLPPTPTKARNYCLHWIKTGKCTYTTQCWYKHEMPPLEKLRTLGMPGVPLWYQKRYALAQRKKDHSQETRSKTLVGASKSPPPPGIDTRTKTKHQPRDAKTRPETETGETQTATPPADKVYGTYTTDTPDEPMLIDWHDALTPSTDTQPATPPPDSQPIDSPPTATAPPLPDLPTADTLLPPPLPHPQTRPRLPPSPPPTQRPTQRHAHPHPPLPPPRRHHPPPNARSYPENARCAFGLLSAAAAPRRQ